MTQELIEYLPGQLWLNQYPVHYFGLNFFSRMTVIRLSDGCLLLHSPCNIDEQMQQSIQQIGKVAYIVAPGSYHYLYIVSAQQAFPDAQTYICPGIERKQPQLEFDGLLADKAPQVWALGVR